MVEFFAKMFGQALGVPETTIRAMLEGYSDVLYQAVYTPEFAKIQKQRKKKATARQVKKKLDDEALLRRLERFTEPDEPGPQGKAGARRR